MRKGNKARRIYRRKQIYRPESGGEIWDQQINRT